MQYFGQQTHPIQAIAERSVCDKFEENRSTIAMNNNERIRKNILL